MKSVSHHVKKSQNCSRLHSQDFVIVVAFFVSKNYVIKQLLTIEALDMI